jgi:hypothetical protein
MLGVILSLRKPRELVKEELRPSSCLFGQGFVPAWRDGRGWRTHRGEVTVVR